MLLCPKILPIMPALCSMPACTYYASNYASILGSGLTIGNNILTTKYLQDIGTADIPPKNWLTAVKGTLTIKFGKESTAAVLP